MVSYKEVPNSLTKVNPREDGFPRLVPEKSGYYFVIYHTGKALCYFDKSKNSISDARWKFVGGGATTDEGIIAWYKE